MIDVPESHQDLLDSHVRAYAYLATLMPDGSPQVTPVRFDTDGDAIPNDSARGRVKDRHMRDRPQIALLITDPNDLLRYVQIRPRIGEIVEAVALGHIGRLSQKYRGKPWTPVVGQTRVVYRLIPTLISVS